MTTFTKNKTSTLARSLALTSWAESLLFKVMRLCKVPIVKNARVQGRVPQSKILKPAYVWFYEA